MSHVMPIQKRVIEFEDFVVTIVVRSKDVPKPDNENVPYDHWSEELKEFLAKYDK
jgi:hypothetical protein